MFLKVFIGFVCIVILGFALIHFYYYAKCNFDSNCVDKMFCIEGNGKWNNKTNTCELGN